MVDLYEYYQHYINDDKDAKVKNNKTVISNNEPNQSMLPENLLFDFVESNFRKGRQFVHTIGGHLTPCYLFEPSIIIYRAKAFKKAFQHYIEDAGFYFAMKSNNFPDVSKTILTCGFGLDVSSGYELETALKIGAKDIVFSGPGKTVQELDIAVSNSEKVVVLMDSFTEAVRLEKRAARQSKSIRAGIRLTTEPDGIWRKFGIPAGELKSFIQELQKYKYIKLEGLQFHSSWNMTPERQINFIKILGETIAQLSPNERNMIKFIDIGGGYWPEQGEWLHPDESCSGKNRDKNFYMTHCLNKADSIEIFAKELSNAISEHIHDKISCRICFEPGRWICNDSMHIILKVVDKKYDDLVITDGGTNAVGWERFETDYCPLLNISRPAMTERECLILGSLCTPHDVWAYSYWGRDIQDGDLLMIPSQGAYTYSLRQNFIKAAPNVISFP